MSASGSASRDQKIGQFARRQGAELVRSPHDGSATGGGCGEDGHRRHPRLHHQLELAVQ